MKQSEDKLGPFHAEVVRALGASLPEGWKAAVLDAHPQKMASGGMGMGIEIRSPEGLAGHADITVELAGALGALYRASEERGAWTEAEYSIRKADGGDWEFAASFSYD